MRALQAVAQTVDRLNQVCRGSNSRQLMAQALNVSSDDFLIRDVLK